MRKYVALLGWVALLLSGCASMSEHRLPSLPAQDRMVQAPGKLKWSTKVPSLSGAPAVVGEMVYTADFAHYLTAYDRTSGHRRWRKKYADWFFSTGPVVAGAQLVLGTQNGQVVAFDAKSGVVRWAQAVSSEVLAAPVVHADTVYAHALDGAVFALDLQDGHERWAFHHANPPLVLRTNSAPVADRQQVWVGMADGHLVDLDAQTGAVRWEKVAATPEGRTDVQRMVDIAATPRIDDGVLYVVSYQGHLSALSAQTGSVLWQRPISGYREMDLDATALYVTNAKGEILALERSQGTILWRQDGLTARGCTGPVVVGDYVVVGDSVGYLHWLSKKTGQSYYYQRVMKGPIQHIVATPTQLLVTGAQGTLAAFNLKR